MKNIVFIRFKNSKIGGAETYLQRITHNLNALNFTIFSTQKYEDISTLKVNIPKFLPKFIQFLLFLCKYESHRKNNQDSLYFSLERVLHCDIYRAGDGIHKKWLNIKANTPFKKIKSYFNPMNLIYLTLEPKLFLNAKIITYDFNKATSILIKLLSDTKFLSKMQKECAKKIPTLEENIHQTLKVIHNAL